MHKRAYAASASFLLPRSLFHAPFHPSLPTSEVAFYVVPYSSGTCCIRVDREVLAHSERWRAHAVPFASKTALVSQSGGLYCCPYAGCGKAYQQRTSVVISYFVILERMICAVGGHD